MHSQRTHNQTPKSKKVAYQQATKRLQCSYTWRRTRLHLLLHFLSPPLCSSFLFLLANTACISCIVACFGSNNFWFVALANAVCCLSSEGACAWKLRFRSRNAKRKAATKKKKKRGKRKTGRNNKEEPKVHREHTQPGEARHGTARHGDTAHFLSAAATRASFCQGLLAILQCLCATHTQPRLCLC